jgi:hypothetical protein
MVCTRALKALRALALRHQVQKHEIILFQVTTGVLPCEAGERWVQNSLPGTKPKNPWIDGLPFEEVNSFYDFSQHHLQNTRESMGNNDFAMNKEVIKSYFWIHFRTFVTKPLTLLFIDGTASTQTLICSFHCSLFSWKYSPVTRNISSLVPRSGNCLQGRKFFLCRMLALNWA